MPDFSGTCQCVAYFSGMCQCVAYFTSVSVWPTLPVSVCGPTLPVSVCGPMLMVSVSVAYISGMCQCKPTLVVCVSVSLLWWYVSG